MNVLGIIALTATLFNLVLTAFILAKDHRSILNRIYVCWGLTVAVWNLSTFFLYRQIDPHEAFLWAKMLHFGVIFMPVTLFHLCLLVSHTQANRLMRFMYLLHFGFAASLLLGYHVVGVRKMDAGYWAEPGPTFWVFMCSYSVITTALVTVLYKKQKNCTPLQRTRLRSMLLAIIALWVFGTNDLFPILGLDHYPLTSIKFYPLGNLAALFYVVMVGYSTMQHQLLDIHVALSRLAAQIVRLLFMFLIGFFMLLILSWAAPDKFTSFAFFSAVGVLLVSALAASFFFPQFFGKGTDKLERQILGDRFEYHARVQSFIQTMRSYPDPEFLLEELQGLLANTMKIRNYHIILLDETTRGFVVFHSMPSRPQALTADVQVDSAIFRYFHQTNAKYLSCEPENATAFESGLEREARAQIASFEPRLCFPFFVGSDLVGLLLLGPKVNLDPFTPHDLDLLVDLSSNLGLVLNQIRLRHQLQLAHEQDLLGRMSRGLAHDLNNLLTPVQTFLQLCQEARIDQEIVDELLPMALRNLTTVRAYVSEALFFSRTASLRAQPDSLTQAIRDAIATAQTSTDNKTVNISFDSKEEVTIEMDGVLIRRLISNLLSNALDASQPGSSIEVTVQCLPRTELTRDWYRVQIIDHGEGISRENLKRVFTPYFTTKNTGDRKRGFGLGLAIARKIAHLHGGNLSVASKEKVGTTVHVDLPGRIQHKMTAEPAAETAPA